MSNIEQSVEESPQEGTIEDDQFITYAQRRFYTSSLYKEARRRLQALVDSPDYNTDPSPVVSTPVPFVERHLNHLRMYPKTNLDGYLSNLKLMTSVKRSRATH